MFKAMRTLKRDQMGSCVSGDHKLNGFSREKQECLMESKSLARPVSGLNVLRDSDTRLAAFLDQDV